MNPSRSGHGSSPLSAFYARGRWVGALGLGLALTGVGWFLLPPLDTASDDSARAVVAHYAEHRTAILAFAYLGVAGLALQLVFFAGLRELVDGAPARRGLARVGFAAIVVEVVGVSIAFSIMAAVAHRAPDPEVAHALVDVAWFLINLAAGPVTALGLFAYGLALARSGTIGRWLVPYSAFVALAHLVVAAAFARSGFLSPEGGIAAVVPTIFLSWFAAVGIALLRRPAP